MCGFPIETPYLALNIIIIFSHFLSQLTSRDLVFHFELPPLFSKPSL